LEHYRVDMLAEKQLIVELKAVDQTHSVHQAQLLSYRFRLMILFVFFVSFVVSSSLHPARRRTAGGT
jgi:GxxExxY protein